MKKRIPKDKKRIPKDSTGKALHGLPYSAGEVGLDVKTLREGCEEGRVPGVKFGRVWKIPDWWIRQFRDGPKAI
jgi:hypothetical protein